MYKKAIAVGISKIFKEVKPGEFHFVGKYVEIKRGVTEKIILLFHGEGKNVHISSETCWEKAVFSLEEEVHIIAKKISNDEYDATHIFSGDLLDDFSVKLGCEDVDFTTNNKALKPKGVLAIEASLFETNVFVSGFKPNPFKLPFRDRIGVLENKITKKYTNELREWLNGSDSMKGPFKAKSYLSVAPTYFYRRKGRSRDEILSDFDCLYGYDKIKRMLVSDIESKDLREKHRMPRRNKYLFVGPKGVGKHLIAQLYSKASGLPLEEIDCNMVTSSLDLKGLYSSYENSVYGEFFRRFINYGTSELVLVPNDLDKLIHKGNKDGNPFDSVVSLVSSNSFIDAFISIPISTEHTDVFAFAESTDSLPSSILQYFKVVSLAPYSFEERVNICKKHVPGLTDSLSFSDDVLDYIARNYSDDDGAESILRNVKKIVNELECDPNVDGTKREVSIGEVKDILDKDISESPLIDFHRNFDNYSVEQIHEIEKTNSRINSGALSAEEKEQEITRRNTLIALYKKRPEKADVNKVAEHLQKSHFGMHELKDRIAESLTAKNECGNGLRSILFVGPTGTGKSSIAESIAVGMGRGFTKISLNGINDAATLRGSKRCFSKATYGRITKALLKDSNGVILFDEVDKLNPALSDVLLDLIDSNCFTDEFLEVPVDTSNLMFVFTANDVSSISPYLYNRIDLKLSVEDYTDAEKIKICSDYILTELGKSYGVKISADPNALKLLGRCTRQAGVREIKASLKKLVIYQLAHKPIPKNEIVIDEYLVRELLRDSLPINPIPVFDKPGGAVALAVCSDGTGTAFPVLTTLIDDGKGQTIITGCAGEDVRETVEVCKTIFKMHCDKLKDQSIHIHFGESSVKKSGTSAGVAIFISMYSALFDIVVPNTLAYTGEIDIFGNVYPVGGVKSKLIGAEHVGCKKVFLPKENYNRLHNFSSNNLFVEPVEKITDVLSYIKNHHAVKLTDIFKSK